MTNDINLNGGTTWMKLNRSGSPTSDKLVSLHSTITYGGTLVVTNIGGRLQAGDTFTLFSGASFNASTFSWVVLPTYYTWDTSQLGVNGSVKVTAALPVPIFSHVDFSMLHNGTITLNAIHGLPNGPVSVFSSTNLALPLSSWTNITTTTFDGSGNLSCRWRSSRATLPQSYFLLLGQ